MEKRAKAILFPPRGYIASAINAFLANALELTAPASDALLKNRKNPWVQLAGHPGAFAPAGPHTIWKKRMTKENNETVAYQQLMNDPMRDVIPKFYREVEYNGDFFIEMEDLLQHFHDPSIMDIKIGTRTFLESEVKNPVLRKDLYEKMVKLAPDEPTDKEHEQKAITKLRYMQFREKNSSTTSLGFRIEATKLSGDALSTDLKKIKSNDEVRHTFSTFLRGNTTVLQKLIARLNHLRDLFESSPYFKIHEIVGSSLLIMYDGHCKCNAWMIDFAKTMPLADRYSLDHRTAWQVGNHEDGYLVGIDSLINILGELDMDKYKANGVEKLSRSSIEKEEEEASVEKGLLETRNSEKDNRKQSEKQQQQHDLIHRTPSLRTQPPPPSSSSSSSPSPNAVVVASLSSPGSVIRDINLTESECNNKSKTW